MIFRYISKHSFENKKISEQDNVIISRVSNKVETIRIKELMSCYFEKR